MNTYWKVIPVHSSAALPDVPLHCDLIMSRNNSCHNNYMLPQIYTTPVSPTGATQVYSDATYDYGVIPRGNYIFFFALGEGVHRYDLVNNTDDWMSDGIGSDLFYTRSFTVLDDEHIILLLVDYNGYKKFEKQNLVTRTRTTIVSGMGYGRFCWHWRIVGSKLVYMLIYDNPGGGERSHDLYVYDINTHEQLFSSIGSIEGADSWLKYQVCQSVVVDNDVYFEYHSGLSDYNYYEETAHIIRINIASYEITVYRPEYNGNNVYVYHMTYNPADNKIYFIAYDYPDSANQKLLVGRITPVGGSVEWLYSVPGGGTADQTIWPRALIPSKSNVYMVKKNGQVSNVLAIETILITIASVTSTPYPPDFPQPSDLSNIVDDDNYIWYIESNDVKAKDLDTGDLVVNLDTNLPTASGTYGIRQMYISNGKLFVLISSRPGTNYIYEVS